MKTQIFKRPFVWVLVSVCFALFVLIVPVSHAQGSPRSENEKSQEEQRYLEVMNSVYNFVLDNYVEEIDARILYEGALKGMLDAIGDPYTVYMDATEVRSLTDTTDGNFGGVGLSITKPTETSAENPAYVEVVSAIEDTPGWRAGIQSGDKLTKIDDTLTEDITMDEVLNILRGEVGSAVEVSVLRGKTEFSVTLIRALIEVPTVKYGMITEEGRNVGYIRIIQFTPQTPDRVEEALKTFELQNYDSLIIDLRNNPGGLIDSVADVADQFIDSGVIVSTKSRLMFENTVFRANQRNTTMEEGIPIVVLINQGSASASEILAGALKDYHLAYLVGEKTFGKGSVQQVRPLPNDDGLKITMARYYTPSDTNIDGIGIPPDLEVLYPELSEEEALVYVELLTTNVIGDYVQENPSMSESEISAYAKILARDYSLEENVLRRLIRMKAYPDALYDLDFDIQLLAALEILDASNFNDLVQDAKTLSELQASVVIEEELDN